MVQHCTVVVQGKGLYGILGQCHKIYASQFLSLAELHVIHLGFDWHAEVFWNMAKGKIFYYRKFHSWAQWKLSLLKEV